MLNDLKTQHSFQGFTCPAKKTSEINSQGQKTRQEQKHTPGSAIDKLDPCSANNRTIIPRAGHRPPPAEGVNGYLDTQHKSAQAGTRSCGRQQLKNMQEATINKCKRGNIRETADRSLGKSLARCRRHTTNRRPRGTTHSVKKSDEKLAQVNVHKSTCASYFSVCGEKRVHVV